MKKPLGWYEIQEVKNEGLVINIYSIIWRKQEHESFSGYPDIVLWLEELDPVDFPGEWFVAEMNIRNPTIMEFCELAVTVLANITAVDPENLSETFQVLDQFLLNKRPQLQ